MVPIPVHPLSAVDNSTIQQIETAILEDRHVTGHQLVHEVKISVGSVEKIIYDHMHMWQVSALWFPRLLTPLQKQERVNCAKALLTMYLDNQEDFFDKTNDNFYFFHPNQVQFNTVWC